MDANPKFNWERVTSLYSEALEIKARLWDTWLMEQCSKDELDKGLNTYVLRLLKSSPRADAFFDALNNNIDDDLGLNKETIEYSPGDRFDKFKIIKQLGHGGMARVYLCERDDGQFDQKVAIKVMNVQGDVEALKERFRQEQQILAAINHPNIAQLYDGGFTDEGHPYLIMEYVEGESIDSYCQRRKLGLKERASLFVQVCNALQYAHNKLIVHHDIKPANILVNKDGIVKLLDFGISYLLYDQEKKEGQPAFAGTLQYASPEQFEGAKPSVSSDIYKLGLVFYNLLTSGIYDYHQSVSEQGNQQAYQYFKNKLREFEPLNNEGSLLICDLSAIFAKALAPKPEDRFVTVSSFAHDLQNLIHNHPLHSHESDFRYRMKKNYARNKARYWLLAGFNIALIIAVGFFIAQYFETIREKQRAEQILQFVWEIFDSADPAQSAGEQVTALELLDNSKERIEGLEDQPFLQSELFLLTGQLVSHLGDWDQAGNLFSKALEYLPEKNDRVHLLQKAKIYRNISSNLFDKSELALADSVIDRAVIISQMAGRKGRRLIPDLMVEKANILRHKGEYEPGLEILENSIETYRTDLGFPRAELAKALNVKASLLRELHILDDALNAQSEAYEILKPTKNQHIDLYLSTLNNLSILQQRNGLMQEALNSSKRSLEMYSQFYGDDNPLTVRAQNNLGAVYHRKGERAKADSIYEIVYKRFSEILGPKHQYTVSSLFNLANSLYEQGMYNEVLPLFYKVLEADKESLGESHPLVANDYIQLGNVYMGLENWQKAEQHLMNGKKVMKNNFGEQHANISRVYFFLGQLYGRQGLAVESLAYLRQSVDMAKELLGEEHENTIRYQKSLAAYEENFSGTISQN